MGWCGGLLGAGTAMVYPTLLAVIGDVAHPAWRASAVGVYRLWRDAGFAVGALLAGVIADRVGDAGGDLEIGRGGVVSIGVRDARARAPPTVTTEDIAVAPTELRPTSRRSDVDRATIGAMEQVARDRDPGTCGIGSSSAWPSSSALEPVLEAVFGDPVRQDNRTVIPVARVAGLRWRRWSCRTGRRSDRARVPAAEAARPPTRSAPRDRSRRHDVPAHPRTVSEPVLPDRLWSWTAAIVLRALVSADPTLPRSAVRSSGRRTLRSGRGTRPLRAGAPRSPPLSQRRARCGHGPGQLDPRSGRPEEVGLRLTSATVPPSGIVATAKADPR